MHLDEIEAVVESLEFPGVAQPIRQDGSLVWHMPSSTAMAHIAYEATATLEPDGLFFVAGVPRMRSPREAGAALAAITEWCTEAYLQILSHWSVLHADVARGVVRVGVAGLVGWQLGRQLRVEAGDPPRLVAQTVRGDQIRPLLLTESCRRYIYSTTARFRQFGSELNEIRQVAIQGRVSRGAQVSVSANQRIEDSRTIRNRLEIAVQTIRHRLDQQDQTVGPFARDLAELILVAEHMHCVWATQEQNFAWVVQHINLRASIAERASIRSFTAAVFAVAAVALMRDVADSSLTIGIIHWTAYRAIILALGCAAVLVLSYVLYLGAKRVFP